VSRSTGVGKVKVISKCNGGVAVPENLKEFKTICLPHFYHQMINTSIENNIYL
jgi:hypothetical protein